MDELETKEAKRLLDELLQHRDKLMGQLLHPRAAGNLEVTAYDSIVSRLGAVQGCIMATREILDD